MAFEPIVVDMTVAADEVVFPCEVTADTIVFPVTLSTQIVVNAIPSNYGLITWNGSVLTVS